MTATITAAELSEAIGHFIDDGDDPAPRIVALLAMATEVVESYAPNAPAVLLNEAVIRFAGYLAATGWVYDVQAGGQIVSGEFGALRARTTGEDKYEYQANHAAAFRHCGAAALLSRYKRRRAAPIAGGPS